MNYSFPVWLKMLDQVAKWSGYKTESIVAATDVETWRPYYEQGLAPGEALSQSELDSAGAEAEINGEVE